MVNGATGVLPSLVLILITGTVSVVNVRIVHSIGAVESPWSSGFVPSKTTNQHLF
jgi:hypothetical protein